MKNVHCLDFPLMLISSSLPSPPLIFYSECTLCPPAPAFDQSAAKAGQGGSYTEPGTDLKGTEEDADTPR